MFKVLAATALVLLPISAIAQPTDAAPSASARSNDAADDQQCASYGAKVGSEAYVECRLKLDELRQRKESVTKSRPIRCRSIYFGGIAKTRCK